MDAVSVIALWLGENETNKEIYSALVASNQVSAFRAGVAMALEQIEKQRLRDGK